MIFANFKSSKGGFLYGVSGGSFGNNPNHPVSDWLARYQFDSGSYLVDTAGGSSLTNSGTIEMQDTIRGGVASFDGLSDSLTGMAKPSSATTNMSYSFWFLYDNIGDIPLSKTATSGSHYIHIKTTTTIDVKGTSSATFTVPAMSSGTWYHCAITKDDSQNVRCYLNGTESSTGVLTINAAGLDIDMIGDYDNGTGFDWDGLLDNVTIYEKVLTAAEVTSIYNFELLTNSHPVSDWLARYEFPNYDYEKDFAGGPSLTNNGSTSSDDSSRSHVASFDGVNDYFSGAATGNSSGAASWCFWFNPDTTSYMVILGDSGSAAEIAVQNSTNIRLRDSTPTSLSFATDQTLSAGTWYHCVITRDASNNCRMYFNGTESSTGAQSATATIPLPQIGKRNDANFEWDGLVDNVTYYSRQLSAAEVTSIYDFELL